jgi:hypothetical protein
VAAVAAIDNLATISGQGYRIVAPVARTEEPSPAPRAAAPRMHNLPAPVTRVIDRSDRVGALPAQLPGRRFITIVGPGGIGKSTVALAVAEGLIEGYDHGVRFVDLAQIRDPLQVPGALVDALGLEIRSDDPIPELIASLQARQCCSCSITASMSSRLNDLRDRRRGR